MKHFTNIIRHTATGFMLSAALAVFGPMSVPGQDQQKDDSQKAAPARRGERDPFTVYKAPRRKVVPKNVAMPVEVPPIQVRIEQYKALKMAAMRAQQSAPKPTTALLLGEMQVTGIFRTPRGYAAMVEATPIKLSYVVYPGERFFDGQLVAIEEDRLVFRHEVRWSDGRVVKNVETKPLRQPNAVVDSMAVTKAPSGASAPATSEAAVKAEDQTAPSQKQ